MAVPAGVTFRVKAGMDAQRAPCAPAIKSSRMLPPETMWIGNGSTLGDMSQARC